MGKFDPYSRRDLRRLRATYLRRNRAVVAAIAAGFAALLAFETAVVLYVLSGPVTWYVLGLVHAGLVAAGLHLLHTGHVVGGRRERPTRRTRQKRTQPAPSYVRIGYGTVSLPA
jgi:hypothetical protein